jgi:hypothetical protein
MDVGQPEAPADDKRSGETLLDLSGAGVGDDVEIFGRTP